MRNWIKHSCYIILGLMGFKTSDVLAQQEMYLCINGVAGETASKSDPGCIDILAWSWGASNSGQAGSGGGSNSFQDISFTKLQDSTSTFLMKTVANGKLLSDFVFRVRKSCGVENCEGPVIFTMTVPASSKLTSISQGGSYGETRSTENISINMPSATWCNTAYDVNGTPVNNLVCDSYIFIDPQP